MKHYEQLLMPLHIQAGDVVGIGIHSRATPFVVTEVGKMARARGAWVCFWRNTCHAVSRKKPSRWAVLTPWLKAMAT